MALELQLFCMSKLLLLLIEVHMRQLQLANWFWLKFWDKIKLNYIEKWPIGRIHAQFLIGKCFIAKNISTFSLHLASLGSKLDVSRQIFSHVWNVKLKMMHMKTGKVVSRDAWNKKHCSGNSGKLLFWWAGNQIWSSPVLLQDYTILL